MSTGWAILVAALAAAVAIAAGAAMAWRRATHRAVRRLTDGAPAIGRIACDIRALDGLPAPVARYLRFALAPGARAIESARIEQVGEFRMGGIDAPWRPFTAVHHVAVAPPGFVWDASIRMLPFVTVRVRDSYTAGAGALVAKLASLIGLADQVGSPELDAGELQRYLAESVWYPTALLPGMGVTWTAIGDDAARATLTHARTSVSLEFRFGPHGGIVSAHTEARWREVAGRYVPTPWECTYGAYERHDDATVPVDGEVAWLLPEGRLSYWRARLVGIAYRYGGEAIRTTPPQSAAR